MSLQVIQAGALTLLQDFGRYGQGRHGLSPGGPMDDHAFLWANTILANHYNDPQLEITLGGFRAEFTQPTTIAVCGADLLATLNGEALPLWQSIPVHQGDQIKFASPRMGLRAYLAVKNGFEVAQHVGSCATVMREKMGGLYQNGEKIKTGDCIPFTSLLEKDHSADLGCLMPAVPISYRPYYAREIILRFIPNLSAIACDRAVIDQFIARPWLVSTHSDRMGYRLEGEKIECTKASGKKNILSHGLATGTIQLPTDGQPIILMKDRQTMGGYPQIGCVVSRDIALLAQSLPGTRVRFTPVTISDVQQEWNRFKQFFSIPF